MGDRFEEPDLTKPLDTALRLRGCPPSASVKGILLQAIVKRAAKAGVQLDTKERRFVAFKDYPLTDYIALLAEASERVQPARPARETLKQFGEAVLPAILESIAGKVFFGMWGLTPDGGRRALRAVATAYRLVTNHANATLVDMDEARGVAVVGLDQVWSFPDCYHVGILESAARHYNPTARCLVRTHSISQVDLQLTWVPTEPK